MQNKNLGEILEKLNISQLNAMQEEAYKSISENTDCILLSPTGSGKTLAFLLPLLRDLDPELIDVQLLILVPSRELAIQIEQVIRDMGSGHKANAVYGGRAFSKDKIELKHPPTILVGTPGRVADHFRRESFATERIKAVVLDEFDKSLEIGFEKEMKEIIHGLPNLEKRILTSATEKEHIPKFIGIKAPVVINYLEERKPNIEIKTLSVSRDKKLEKLAALLAENSAGSGIIFCNYKDSIKMVSEYLQNKGFTHGIFSGGMEQKDRERSLLKFRNGTYRLLIATDLAARGIDVPALDFIVHFQLPLKAAEFTHRNGRTARMNREGTAFVLSEKETLPEFISPNPYEFQNKKIENTVSDKATLFISGGRKDKISKGDITGLFLKQGGLQKDQLGLIELKEDCAFLAVPKNKAEKLILKLNNSRLKKKKVRISVI